jgi:hypothetical protein
VAYQGFVATAIEGRLVVLERRPSEGAPTIVLAWPGSLGALVGASADLYAAQVEVPLDVRRGSLKGPPFAVGFRVALERAKGLDDFWARLPRLSGNRVLAGQASGDRTRFTGLVAYAGEDPTDHDPAHWVLAPAGEGGPASALTQRQDEALGAYAERPGAVDAPALAIAGRSPEGAGPVVGATFGRILWWGTDAAGAARPPTEYAAAPR